MSGGPGSPARVVTVLVPAVGGQGGGLLSEWIVEAAAIDGLLAQGTSIPGVAQRTGSTTYYVELFAGPPAPAPVFSLYPVPGAVDVLLAPEFLEVGRAIEQGFPSPERTTIVASTHRLYSIHEKMATGRGIHPQEELHAAARAFSRTLVAFDALGVAREHGTEVNAVLLGALAATRALPVSEAAFRQAIERKGVAVAANLAGFDVGRELAGGHRPPPAAPAPRELRSPAAFADVLAALPADLRPTVGEALARLVDYQSARYARRYLRRLAPFAEAGGELAQLVARHLAVWMTYEDAIRVADLKTRASRLARIRAEVGAPGAEVVVVDYLKPDLDELYGVLPAVVVAPFARWAERRWPHGRPTPGQHVKTTTILGFLRLWLLGRCRWLRPVSYRARREHERMERWLAAVRECARRDPELACEVARAAQLVKGYGEVRRRMSALFDDLLDCVSTATALDAERGGGVAAARELARDYRTLVLKGPEGEAEARELARAVLGRLRADGRLAAAPPAPTAATLS